MGRPRTGVGRWQIERWRRRANRQPPMPLAVSKAEHCRARPTCFLHDSDRGRPRRLDDPRHPGRQRNAARGDRGSGCLNHPNRASWSLNGCEIAQVLGLLRYSPVPTTPGWRHRGHPRFPRPSLLGGTTGPGWTGPGWRVLARPRAPTGTSARTRLHREVSAPREAVPGRGPLPAQRPAPRVTNCASTLLLN